MSDATNRELIARQAKLIKEMDIEAKAHGAFCTSPIDARREVLELEKMGQVAVSKNKVEIAELGLLDDN